MAEDGRARFAGLGSGTNGIVDVVAGRARAIAVSASPLHSARAYRAAGSRQGAPITIRQGVQQVSLRYAKPPSAWAAH
ncbi:MAG: hypothetical protein ACRDPY_41435, partial [Streptosporangiaceae bacterium]